MRINIIHQKFLLRVCGLFLLLAGINAQAGTDIPPLISNGVLDLRSWDFANESTVPLRGEWEFYWNSLHKPELFNNVQPPVKTGYLHLPGLWNGYKVDGKKLPGSGYATYRLTILLPENMQKPLALKFPTVNTAFTFYINNNKITGNGLPATARKQYVARYLPHVASFMPDNDTLNLVMHVANFSDAKGGPWKTILLGNESYIRERRERKIAFELFLLGCILIIAIHYLTIYLHRKKDSVSLYFSLFCFSIALRTLVIGERYLHHILPQVPWEIMRRVEFWTMHFPTALFCLFIYHLYNAEYPKKIIKAVVITALAFAGLVLIIPAPFFTYTALPFEIFILAAAGYIVYVVIRAIQNKREGAFVILLGCIVLFMTLINDILYDNSIIQTVRLIPVGLFFFLFSQAILLSKRSANAYTKIENLSAHLSEMNESLKRFVPYEFLQFLERNNIVEIRLGDQVLKRMTILFSDVRSFTTISEKMTPQDNFNFINNYLEKISPAITQNNGFIDKYVGDAIMALFPKDSDDAIRAAITMQHYVEDFNNHCLNKSYPSITVGIGAHTGSLMLGTIGNEDRMETTVISDTVNIASRMENLTKWYGAGIIISQEMINASRDPEAYHYRSLGAVQVKGKKKPVSIIEMLDGLPEELFEIKMETKDFFETGISHFQQREIKQAKKFFAKVLKKNSNDSAAAIFIKRCNHLIDTGIPKEWSGVEVVDYI